MRVQFRHHRGRAHARAPVPPRPVHAVSPRYRLHLHAPLLLLSLPRLDCRRGGARSGAV